MKNLIALTMALAILFTLGACGAHEAPAATTAAATTEAAAESTAEGSETTAVAEGPETAAVLDSGVLKANTLVVGISSDYPPFESLDDNGNIVGFDADMATYLASVITTSDGTPYHVEFVNMDFHNIISALQLDQIDLGIAAFSYSPERKCTFSEPYYSSAQVVAVRADSDFTSIADLNGKLVVAGEGTVGYQAATEMIEGAEVTNAGGSYLTMFEMVRTGQCDAIVADSTVAQTYVDSGNFKIIDTLTSDELCVTVKEGNDVLVEAVNKAIDQFMASGEYENLREKWGV